MKKIWLLSAMSLLLILNACDESNKETSYHIDQDQEQYPEAVELFSKQRCISCHASDLQGNMGEESDLSKVGSRLTKQQLIDVITNGRNRMPSFGEYLTEEQIDALAEWLHSKK